MSYRTKFYVYLVFLLIAFVLGLLRRRQLARTDRWLLMLMLLTVIQEIISYICSIRFKTNTAAYHIYSPVELLVICSYFDGAVRLLRRRHIGLIIGVAGAVISVLNTALLQPLHAINTYFLLFEGCTVIILCQFSMLQIVQDEDMNPKNLVSFWVTVCFLLYWSTTFAGWGLYGFNKQWHIPPRPVVEVLYFSNLSFYIGLACIFYNYSRLIPSGE